uniref:Putative Cuticle protein n=1 Tax=Daphnia magna TaxID=35525 RepID=A0A0N8DQV2_9CRUS
MSFSFVFDISGITVLVRSVGNELCPAVWKGNSVRTSGYLAVRVFRVNKVIVRFLVLHIVRIAVWLRWVDDLSCVISMKFLIFVTLLVLAAADTDIETEYEALESQDTRQVVYPPQPYSYSYNVQDEESNNDFIHSENTDGKVTTGSYRVSLPDGRTQLVTYRADENGYTANVEYEGEAHHPDGYVAPPSPSFQTPVSVPYSVAASSNNKVREAPVFKETAVSADKEPVAPNTKTSDEPAYKETTASSTKTRDAPSYKESTSPSVKESTAPAYSPPSLPSYQTAAPVAYQATAPPSYNPPSPPAYSPPSPPAYSLPAPVAYNPPSPPAYSSPSPLSYQTPAPSAYQSSAYKTVAYRSPSPSAYRGPSAPGYRPSAYGFTPIGPTPLAYRG